MQYIKQLTRLAPIAAVILIAIVALAPISTDNRTAVSGRAALVLNGNFAGWLRSADGGEATAEVINETVGPDFFVKKHIGQPKYGEITLEFGTGMTQAVYDWMQASLTANNSRKDGAIVYADFNGKEVWRREFFEALITEIGFPALDAGSKEATWMILKITPEYTRRTITSAGSALPGAPGGTKSQKAWLPSNFRLRIDGLEQATNRVNKIEALVVKQSVVQDDIGDARDLAQEPGKLEFPNLVITLADKSADPFTQWHEDFVIKGNNDQSNEKNGTLEYLTPNQQEVLFTLTFSNLGIFKLTPDKSESGGDAIKRVTAEMYVERIQFGNTAASLK